jgi:predicted anti-sigma-YlaC factor YlaD
MRCETFREQLEPYLEERLVGDARQAWREHLQGCAECRQWAAIQEPTLLLSSLPSREADPARVAACAAAVTALIHQERLRSRLRPRLRSYLAAAAAILGLALAGLLWRTMPSGGDPSGRPQVTPIAATVAIAPESDALPPPQVEVDMTGEGVRVYHFASDQDASTAMLFIVNPALES